MQPPAPPAPAPPAAAAGRPAAPAAGGATKFCISCGKPIPKRRAFLPRVRRRATVIPPSWPTEKKAAQFPCPGCAADMQFDPATGGMKCPFCGQTQALAAPAGRAAVSPHAFDEFVAAGASQLQPLTGQALEVSCDGCGSVVAFEPPEVAGLCPFCGAALVAQPKAADPLISPDGLLPAKVPKDQACTEVRAMAAVALVRPQRAQTRCPPGRHQRRLSALLGLRRRYRQPLHRRARPALLGNGILYRDR